MRERSREGGGGGGEGGKEIEDVIERKVLVGFFYSICR